jgi:hypothetical protein
MLGTKYTVQGHFIDRKDDEGLGWAEGVYEVVENNIFGVRMKSLEGNSGLSLTPTELHKLLSKETLVLLLP